MKPTTATTKPMIHRSFEGTVMTAPGNKTITVRVATIKMHAKYRKQYTTTRKYAVHDENNEAKVGMTVTFEECRPLSKTKRWRLVSMKK